MVVKEFVSDQHPEEEEDKRDKTGEDDTSEDDEERRGRGGMRTRRHVCSVSAARSSVSS